MAGGVVVVRRAARRLSHRRDTFPIKIEWFSSTFQERGEYMSSLADAVQNAILSYPPHAEIAISVSCTEEYESLVKAVEELRGKKMDAWYGKFDQFNREYPGNVAINIETVDYEIYGIGWCYTEYYRDEGYVLLSFDDLFLYERDDPFEVSEMDVSEMF
jgi:hypothetical protein